MKKDQVNTGHESLIAAFSPLWECVIKDCFYDMFNGFVRLKIVDPESQNEHTVAFSNVSSCIYLMNSENSFNEEETYHELSSIVFEKEIVVPKKNKWLGQYSLDYNVIIEIVRSALLIKAEKVEIDSAVYDLKV